MGGKASVLLILGFSVIFLVAGSNFNRLTTRSVDNSIRYYTETIARNIALSGANMAASQIYFDKTWGTGYSNVSYSGGVLNVSIDSSGFDRKITSTGIFPVGDPNADTHMVIIDLRPSNFAKFGNFYKTISAQPATGDTFSGPFHVNGDLHVYGDPVFLGKASSKGTLKKDVNPSNPEFHGGYDTGLDIPLEFDTSGMRASAQGGGVVLRDTAGLNRPLKVQLYFNADGTVTHSFSIVDGLNLWTAPQTTPLTTFSPNGLIFVEKGNIYTKGTVNGQATVVASSKGNTSYGKIYQEDDIIYNQDPATYPNSTDMLGLVAEREIRIVSNSNTLGGDVYTHASMFSLLSDIGPESGLISQAGLFNWRILGGLIAKTTRGTANYTYDSAKKMYVPYRGLRFNHRFDERFYFSVPPFFPHTKYYEIVNWFE